MGKGKGYVYLLRFEFSDMYKIGFSAYLPEMYRVEQINESIKGNVRLVKWWKMRHAMKHEKRIHHKFQDKRFTFKGSGKTEWFKLNWLELAIIDIDLSFRL